LATSTAEYVFCFGKIGQQPHIAQFQVPRVYVADDWGVLLDDREAAAIAAVAQRRSPPIHMPLALEAAILSRIRSTVTSCSHCATLMLLVLDLETCAFKWRILMADEALETNTLELATELTIAWLSNPNTRALADEVPVFLAKMHSAVKDLSAPAPTAEATEEQPAEEFTPAVTVRKSLASKDQIVSLIDGKPYKTLKRHLTSHGLRPDQYRQRYGLRSDYPMVAENYSQARRDMAKTLGLGRKPTHKVVAAKLAKPRARKQPASTEPTV
jgi:predicted transcriptional regulator